MEVIVKREFQAKTNIALILFAGVLIVLSIEVFLYFFLQHVEKLSNVIEPTRGYLFTIINPLVELAKRIYIPAIIDRIGIVNAMLITMSTIIVSLFYSIKCLFDKHRPMELRELVYVKYDSVVIDRK